MLSLDPAGLDADLTRLCTICYATPKYRCPRCRARTCSLNCATAHKRRSMCSGLRDRTAFRQRRELATPAGFDHDFNFLSELERKREAGQRRLLSQGAGQDRKGIAGQVAELPTEGAIPRAGEGSDEDGEGDDHENEARKTGDGGAEEKEKEAKKRKAAEKGKMRERLEWREETALSNAIDRAGVIVQRAPGEWMARRAENRSKWHRKKHFISWTVEWLISTASERDVGHPLAPVRPANQDTPHTSTTTTTTDCSTVDSGHGMRRMVSNLPDSAFVHQGFQALVKGERTRAKKRKAGEIDFKNNKTSEIDRPTAKRVEKPQATGGAAASVAATTSVESSPAIARSMLMQAHAGPSEQGPSSREPLDPQNRRSGSETGDGAASIDPTPATATEVAAPASTLLPPRIIHPENPSTESPLPSENQATATATTVAASAPRNKIETPLSTLTTSPSAATSSSLHFYLHLPARSYGAKKALLHVPTSGVATLRDALRGQTVREYPTIYVMDTKPDDLDARSFIRVKGPADADIHLEGAFAIDVVGNRRGSSLEGYLVTRGRAAAVAARCEVADRLRL